MKILSSSVEVLLLMSAMAAYASDDMSIYFDRLQTSWPMDHTGGQLQMQTNDLATGLGTNWFNVAGSDQTNQMASR
jgi:hypothetical protein